MIFNSGKYLVRMCWIEPNEWLVFLNKQKAMIMGTNCYRPYSTKEKIKKKPRQKEEVVQSTPEVIPEKVEGKSELTKNDEIIKEIIEKSKKEKKMKTIEPPRKYPVISDYLIQNIMDFPLHKPADFDDCITDEVTSEIANTFPSISTILNETRSSRDRCVLDRWKKKMILQLGETEFYNQQTDPVKKPQSKRALPKNVKKSKKLISEKIARGNQFHTIIKKHLLGEDYEKLLISDDVKGCFESVSDVINELSDAKLVESSVFHPLLHYKGIIDCIANYRNEWHVIEWKVGGAAKNSLANTYTAPVQTCAYMGTLSWCKHLNINEPVLKGLIVFAFPDGSPAQVFPISSSDSQLFWDQWLKRLQLFWVTRLNRGPHPVEDQQNLDHPENSDLKDA